MESFLIQFILYAFFMKIATSVNLIPSFVNVCKQTDSDLDNCIIKTLNDMKPYLSKGIPEMKIAALDPLKIAKLVLRAGNLEANLTELEFRHIAEFEMKHLHLDIDKSQLEFNFYVPKVEEKGKYKLKGHILVLDLLGAGHFTLNYTSVDVAVKAKANRTKKKTREYLDFNEVDMKIHIDDAKVNFENLFEGNQQLTDQTNMVLNENSKALIIDLEPVTNDALKSVLLQAIKNVFDTFPLSELLPK